MSITIEIERNKEAGFLAGKYFDLGGDALIPVNDAEHCPECQGNLEQSKYISFVYCPSCRFDLPASLCIKDKRLATKIFLKGLEEILSNKVDVERYHYARLMVTKLWKENIYNNNQLKSLDLLTKSKEWILFKRNRYEKGTSIKEKRKDYLKYGYITKKTILEFFNFLRTDPRVDEETEGVFGVKISKDELMDIIASKDDEIISLKKTLNEYGLL